MGIFKTYRIPRQHIIEIILFAFRFLIKFNKFLCTFFKQKLNGPFQAS